MKWIYNPCDFPSGTIAYPLPKKKKIVTIQQQNRKLTNGKNIIKRRVHDESDARD